MEKIARRVLMAKKVARQFLSSMTEPQRTLTVYFNLDTDLSSFLRKTSSICDESNTMVCEGFDKVTFVCSNDGVISAIKRIAQDNDHDSAEM